MSVTINIANEAVDQRQSRCTNRHRGDTGDPVLISGAGPKLVKVRAKSALFCVMLDGLLLMLEMLFQ